MDKSYPPIPLESRRIPLLKKVELRFSSRDEAVSEVGINISMTGLFVRSSAPEPAGSVASFRVRLQDGDEPIEGKAEVVWVRKEEAGAYRPAGMGLRFLQLDGDGKARVRAAVERMIAETEAPPELRDLRSVVEETLEGILGIEAEEPPQPLRSSAVPSFRAKESRTVVSRRADRPLWRRFAWVPLVLLLLGGAAFLGWQALSQSGSGGPAAWWASSKDKAPTEQASVEASVGASVAEEVEISSEEPAAPAPLEPEISIDEELQAGAEKVVTAWAAAWSEQRVEDYLSFYSPSFRPADGSSRPRWVAQRRQRISAPRQVQVLVQEMETTLVPPDGAWVQFQQSYRSDNYRDTVLKTLSLSLENGAWRIVEERVDT